jgi:Zn-dependent protease with chaperone function
MSLRGRAFGPDLPAAGAPAMLSLDHDSLTIEVGPARHAVALAALELREVGFGRPGIEVAWVTGGERWAVHVLDPDEAGTLLQLPALAGSGQVTALRRRQRRAGGRRRVGWAALAVVIAAPALLLGMFVLYADGIAGRIAARIPLEQEIALGRSAFGDMRGALTLVDRGPAYEAVRAIGARLTAGSRYAYEFHVAEDETLNAYALPGGIIVVHTGLIDATRRAEELAGVLAHEIRHVEERHSMAGLVKQLGLSALWSLATGDLGGTLAGRAARELVGLKFSRDAESEADEKGFDALVSAGIDPAGMPDFFATMERRSANVPVAFISTHPLSEDRRKRLTIRLEALGGRHFEPLRPGPWPPR